VRSSHATKTRVRRDASRFLLLDDISSDAANCPKSNRDPICKHEFFVGEPSFRAVSLQCYSRSAISAFSLLRVHKSYGLLRPLLEFHTEKTRQNRLEIPTKTADQDL